MPCAGIEVNGRPLDDQFELVVFGPGYGESIVLHLGDGHWVVVDSCLAPNGGPAALEYLASINVDPGKSVKHIIVTHWDDDHIRGIADIVQTCTDAKVTMSAAFSRDEFLGFLTRFDQPRLLKVRTGVSELVKVLETLSSSGRVAKKAITDRIILKSSGPHTVELIALSPSDDEVDNAMLEIGSLLPAERETKRVSVARRPNHLSVVTLGRMGALEFLLGGDLEEDGTPTRGWSNILNASVHNHSQAAIFKSPHHDSASGHHAGVWAQMLAPEPIVVTAPWSLAGRRLPTATDMRRTVGRTGYAFVSAAHADGKAKKRLPGVRKKIDESVRDMRRVDANFGAIRLRAKPGAPGLPLSLELFGHSMRYQDALIL